MNEAEKLIAVFAIVAVLALFAWAVEELRASGPATARGQLIVTGLCVVVLVVALVACRGGPTEADMAGCTVRSGGPPISLREIADCERDRAELGRR